MRYVLTLAFMLLGSCENNLPVGEREDAGTTRADGGTAQDAGSDAGMPARLELAFATAAYYPTRMGNPSVVAVADLDKDGRPDVAVAGDEPYAALFTALSGGTLEAESRVEFAVTESSGVSDLAAVDFDGNTTTDLVLAHINRNTLTLMLRSHTGGYAEGSGQPVGRTPHALDVAALDSDSALDVVVAGTDGVDTLLGDGAGALRHGTNLAVTGRPVAVRVADVTGDGRADVVVGSWLTAAQGKLSVFAATAAGGYDQPRTFDVSGSVQARSLVVVDVDADGRQDLVIGANGAVVFRQDATGTFGPGSAHGTGVSATCLATADFDRDGKVDLAICDADGSALQVLLGTGDGSFGAPHVFSVPLAPLDLAVGDVNEDEKPDLIAVGYDAEEHGVVVLLNDSH